MSTRRIQQCLIFVLVVASCIVFLQEALHSDAPSQPAVAAVAPPTFTLVKAKRRLARGLPVQAADIELKTTSEQPPSGTVARLEDATGLVATREILPAEILSQRNTAATVEAERLADLVPPGLRAMALKVSEDTAVANLLRPGDHVDVLISSNANPSARRGERAFPNAESRTILQNILVLAVGVVTDGEAPNAAPLRNVTLAVTPHQAATMALLRSVGTEYLTLRAAGDDRELNNLAASSSDLQRSVEDRRAKPPPSRKPTRAVDVIRGASENVTTVTVDPEG